MYKNIKTFRLVSISVIIIFINNSYNLLLVNRHFQFLFLVILFLKISEVKSQELAIYKGKREFGISGGGNESSLSGPELDVFRFSDKNGISVGVHHNYYYSEKWSLRTRLGFDQKGGEDILGSLPDRTFNYLTITVFPSWHFGRWKKWYISWGPYIGYLISEESGNIPPIDEIQNIDWGHSFFIGYRIPISQDLTVFLEVGGQSGIASIDIDRLSRGIRTESTIFSAGFLF